MCRFRLPRAARTALRLGLAVALSGCGAQQKAPPPGARHDTARRQQLAGQARSLFGPLPAAMPGSENDAPALVALGRRLFFEPKLSVNGAQSCADCHHLEGKDRNGADDQPTSVGALGPRGTRNAPSVLNAGLHVAQFWDGRAASLEEQAEGPILNPAEMAMPHAGAVAGVLRADASYRTDFSLAFPADRDPVTLRNAARALAAFERTLRTHDRLDRFMGGELDALTDEELRGMQVFWLSGCLSCHNGPTLGARVYHRLGFVKPYDGPEDPGRFAVTKRERDRRVFKVGSLRNVVATPPYFHDGSVPTLEEAVRKMAWLQLGRELPGSDVAAIVAFLGALRDEGPQSASR